MLILELKPSEVIVLYTADGPVVIRLREGEPSAKLAMTAPQSVKIAREPVQQHPVK